MRLDVGVLGPEQLAGSRAGEVFDDVDILAAAVIPLAGVPFGVLVGQDGPGGFQNGGAGVVFGRDEFEPFMLPSAFVLDGLPQHRILLGQCRHRRVLEWIVESEWSRDVRDSAVRDDPLRPSRIPAGGRERTETGRVLL